MSLQLRQVRKVQSLLTERAAFVQQLALPTESGGISTTAFGPLLVRWRMHQAGTRPDEACDKLLRALPTTSSFLLDASYSPLALTRLLGIRLRADAYPCPRPSTPSTFVNHRTEFFDGALAAALPHVQQVVMLGAGWDTRAYGMLHNSGKAIFEVDAPAIQAAKRKALVDGGIDTRGVRFVSVEFQSESWFDALLLRGFNPNLPTFFLWEGITYYLDRATIDETLELLVTECASGSQIAFDYASLEFVNGYGPVGTYTILQTLKLIGEPWTFGISTIAPAREQLVAFAAARQLQVLRFEVFGEEGADTLPFGGLAVLAH